MLCAVVGCNNYNNKNNKQRRDDVSYFHFPKDTKLLNAWVRFCKRKDAFNVKTARICSDHFTSNELQKNLQYEMGFMSRKRVILKPGSVPSVYKPENNNDDTFGRKARIEARENKKIVEKLLQESYNEIEPEVEYLYDEEENEVNNEESCEAATFETSTLTETIDLNYCENCDFLRLNMNDLQSQINSMEEKCNQLITNEFELKERIKSLEMELEQSKLQNEKCLSQQFPSASMERVKLRRLRRRSKLVKQHRWTKDEISGSKSLYTTNAKIYTQMQKKGLPLPSVRTLQRWSKQKKISPTNVSQPTIISLEIERVKNDCES